MNDAPPTCHLTPAEINGLRAEMALVSIVEAMQITGMSRNAIVQALQLKRLAWTRIGQRKYIPLRELRKWIKANTVPAKEIV